MTINYSDIINHCESLSSYEGRTLTDSNGDSLYPVVHITAQDETLLKDLAAQALMGIHSSARYSIKDMALGSTGAEITFVPNTALLTHNDTAKLIQECVCLSVMQKWLEDKSPERSKSYELMYNQMLASLLKLAHRKHQPKLSDYI